MSITEDGFAARMAYAMQKDPTEPIRRAQLNLQVTAVTLAWLVVIPILVVYGLTVSARVLTLTAVLTLVFPFSAAVLATRVGRFGIAGAYIVVTLLMVVPALAIARAG